MDWIWPLYEEHVRRRASQPGETLSQEELQAAFLDAVSRSTATLYVMEPMGETIRFKGLGRWHLRDSPEAAELLTDPNAFIAERFGGGKFKVNFHVDATFVCTHNFRTWGDETWRDAAELCFD